MAKRIGILNDPPFFGQDPARRKAIEAQLYKDFDPKDVLEEIWLSEIALLTTTLEFYRELEAAANLAIANRRGLDAALMLENASKSRSAKIEYDGGLNSKAARMVLGAFDPDDIKHLTAIIDMINKIRRERERIYNQFERKRRPALINAVKYSEVNGGDVRIVDKLSD